MNRRFMQKSVLVSIFLLISVDLIKAQVDVPGDLENEYFQLLALKNQQVNHLGYGLTIDPFVDSLEWSLWDRFSIKDGREQKGLTLLDLGVQNTSQYSLSTRLQRRSLLEGARAHS